jgi:5-methylcytosine-specific restriction endonuclease McrA
VNLRSGLAPLLLAVALAWPGVATAKTKRSREAKAAFKRAHPCPSTGKKTGACPGYVIDHIKPLKRGGADAPENLQWQTVAEGKAKDKWE